MFPFWLLLFEVACLFIDFFFSFQVFATFRLFIDFLFVTVIVLFSRGSPPELRAEIHALNNLTEECVACVNDVNRLQEEVENQEMGYCELETQTELVLLDGDTTDAEHDVPETTDTRPTGLRPKMQAKPPTAIWRHAVRQPSVVLSPSSTPVWSSNHSREPTPEPPLEPTPEHREPTSEPTQERAPEPTTEPTRIAGLPTTEPTPRNAPQVMYVQQSVRQYLDWRLQRQR